jgi:ABC-type antimicrobial peptide transport system permease subunit
MSFGVGRRTRELGIRIALGARPGEVLWLVLRETLVLAGVGVLAGLLILIAAQRLIASQLYATKPNDPICILVAILVMTGIAVLASFLPARRAAKIDPMVALRDE